jgi:hypothetical protein
MDRSRVRSVYLDHLRRRQGALDASFIHEPGLRVMIRVREVSQSNVIGQAYLADAPVARSSKGRRLYLTNRFWSAISEEETETGLMDRRLGEAMFELCGGRNWMKVEVG